ncbi:hypothetical protein MKS88_004735 [Plasmodium brasilianum]|uniref:Uncharacterized protein n=1 Tax=Plasmodium brasilianum TaxID=5824 RepID=A0ACB9Y3H8_PLABR|nr:hypothetical protein MKS88_004735 [Plasmodium brasilianum]
MEQLIKSLLFVKIVAFVILKKKIFKEFDYEYFFKNNSTISDNVYKKIIFKKCGLRFALPLLLFLVLALSLILDKFCGYGLTYGFLKVILHFSPVSTAANVQGVNMSPAIKSLYDFLNKPSLKWFTEVLVSYLYQRFFIIIKKLKSSKKLSSGKSKMNNK